MKEVNEQKMNLIVFHYHFLRGGVRSAVTGSLKAIAHAGLNIDLKIHIITGRKNALDSFLETILFPVTGVTVDPRADYRDHPWPDEQTFREESEQLADTFLDSAGKQPSVFWIHNPTLGKNPLVTAAWYYAAEKALEERLPYSFLYHIHDFAECGRLENLYRLKKCWHKGGLDDLYPLLPNVSYAVLNRSDFERLEHAGISQERIFWIPNVVKAPKDLMFLSKEDVANITHQIDSFARSHRYVYSTKNPNFLMPLRLIRRKNVLEGILLSLLYPEPRNTLITLDATSAQEHPYAEHVKTVVRKLRLPVVIGFGDHLVGKAFPFDQLFGFSESVVTTSLLEGFGFAFLEGLLKQCPILGRNLPFITRDFEPFGFPSEALYNSFRVPISFEERAWHIKAGEHLLYRINELMNIREDVYSRFLERLHETYENDFVDFGSLNLQSQTEVLRLTQDRHYRNNLSFLNDFPKSPSLADEGFLERVDTEFGPEAHAARLWTAFRSPLVEQMVSSTSYNLTQRILETFLDPIYLRPLLGGWQ